MPASTTETQSLEHKLTVLIGERVLETASGFSAETDLYAAGLDSIAIMQLLLLLEEEFGVAIPVESVSRKNFSTVRAIAELIRHRTGAEAPASSPCELSAVAAPESEPIFPAVELASKARSSRRPAAPENFTSAPLRHCDYFVLSFDQLSRQTGQGGLRAHSFLELDRLPDVPRFRELIQEASEFFPMLSAQIHRRWLVGPPEWRPAKHPVPPDLNLYSEDGSAGHLLTFGAANYSDAGTVTEKIVNTPMPPGPDAWLKARFSLLEKRDGGATLIFSWSHLLFDGVGAELFLQELQRLASGSGGEPMPAMPQPLPIQPTLRERWQTARPIVHYFRKLVTQSFDCLGPRKPKAGWTQFEVFTLTVEQTRAANARCEQLCGGWVHMPFHLACAMRAHERVFAHRGLTPASHVCSVPVQTRRKGARGPIFQNHVTMFFGALRHAELGSLETAVARLMEQHAAFVKDHLGDALNDLMHTMRMMPPSLYMKFVALQMRGPFASFFHSHTGEFAAGLDRFLGARVTNAYHVPGIVTPPGTGIFCSEKNGRLVITLSWHESALDETERRLMIEQLLSDFAAA